MIYYKRINYSWEAETQFLIIRQPAGNYVLFGDKIIIVRKAVRGCIEPLIFLSVSCQRFFLLWQTFSVTLNKMLSHHCGGNSNIFKPIRRMIQGFMFYLMGHESVSSCVISTEMPWWYIDFSPSGETAALFLYKYQKLCRISTVIGLHLFITKRLTRTFSVMLI